MVGRCSYQSIRWHRGPVLTKRGSLFLSLISHLIYEANVDGQGGSRRMVSFIAQMQGLGPAILSTRPKTTAPSMFSVFDSTGTTDLRTGAHLTAAEEIGVDATSG